ncbi:DUF808 domain-containing protein [Brevibacterium marinum]|uniref:Uncharacterized protein n=1 Tax=Brevibacterium marinum TaxID=418643 RepID=A0A846S5H4_9MICO|nr:DUF808 domain-containing protein [Brevibacterium marinum]NJC56732.1 hypothetical protein [Brevibacterium marinum]
MNSLRELNWPLLVVLGLLGLVRPAARITLEGTQLPTAVIALGMTVLVTGLWALGLGLARAANPVLGGIVAGLVYAIGAIILSGLLSPILLGHLEGPLAQPLAIAPMLATSGVWGAIAGGLGLIVRRIRWGTWTTGRVRP